MSIDPSISPTSMSENAKAVIEKYGFDMLADNGHFVLIDPKLRKHDKRSGKYGPGGNADLLLTAAVKERKAFEAAAGETTTAKKSAKVSVAKAKGAPTTRATSNTTTNTRESKHTAKNAPDAPATRAKTKAATNKPADEKKRKDNRYVRGFRVLAAQPAMTAVTLSGKAKISTSMAASIVTGWAAASKALAEHVPGKKPSIAIDDSKYVVAFRWLVHEPTMTPQALASKCSMAERTAEYRIEAWNAFLRIREESKSA